LAVPLSETKNDGAGLVAELLQVAPEVKLCVTSRERLNLQEEWLFDVSGLTFPASESLPTDESRVGWSAEALQSYSAVQLFAQAVQRIQPILRRRPRTITLSAACAVCYRAFPWDWNWPPAGGVCYRAVKFLARHKPILIF